MAGQMAFWGQPVNNSKSIFCDFLQKSFVFSTNIAPGNQIIGDMKYLLLNIRDKLSTVWFYFEKN